MKNTLILTLAVTAAAAFSSPLMARDEQQTVQQAAAIVSRFRTLPERDIPRHVLREARGLAILTVVKGGFVISVKGGDGVVLARNAHGWSGPSFIRTGGAGFGAQIGAQVTELVLVLNTPEAVRTFGAGGNVRLGGELSVAAGPLGRSAEAAVAHKAAVYAYSRSQGLFAGVSLEGTVITTNTKANRRYYQADVTPGDILTGRVAPPPSAIELLSKL